MRLKDTKTPPQGSSLARRQPLFRVIWTKITVLNRRIILMPEIIDLRSDTVTQPTPEMRAAMANAIVGDAVIDVDPTVDELENLVAEILGKEAAVYVPSGSMANQVSLKSHCPHGSEFICEADCHIYHYEQAAFAPLAGLCSEIDLRPKIVPSGENNLTPSRSQMMSIIHGQNFCVSRIRTIVGVVGSKTNPKSSQHASGLEITD